MLLEEEGSIQTQPEGENDNPYTNEQEKELYTFLLANSLLILYDKLKSLNLYIDHLSTINVQHQEFDDLCNACLKLNDKPHIKIILKTAIQSIKNEHDQDNDNKIAHFYPSPYIEHNYNKPAVNAVTVVINDSYRIMIFLRFILWVMDHFIIGGSFGSFLLFILSICGMYNICKNPITKKSRSLSIIIACSELFYYVARDSLSYTCYQQYLHTPTSNPLHNFVVYTMITLLLACSLAHIVWKK